MPENSKPEPKGNRAVELIKEGGYQPKKGLAKSPPPKGGSGIKPRPQGGKEPTTKK